MNNTGKVRIFNCNPHPIYLTINGQVIRDVVPGIGKRGKPGQLKDLTDKYEYPFPRMSADEIYGVAKFVHRNIVEVSGSYVKDANYEVVIDPNETGIYDNLSLYIFEEKSILVEGGIIHAIIMNSS